MLEDLLGLFDNKMFLGLSFLFFYTFSYFLELSFVHVQLWREINLHTHSWFKNIPYKHMIIAYKCIHSSFLSTLFVIIYDHRKK